MQFEMPALPLQASRWSRHGLDATPSEINALGLAGMADANTRQYFFGFHHLWPKIVARQAKFLLEAWISWLPICRAIE
jgi:hypothetical protein